ILNNTVYSTPVGADTSDSTIGYGGGIWNNGTLTIVDSTVEYNLISYQPLMHYGTISIPQTYGYGGGAYNGSSASMTLTRVVVKDNVLDLPSSGTPSLGYGGGVYNAATA